MLLFYHIIITYFYVCFLLFRSLEKIDIFAAFLYCCFELSTKNPLTTKAFISRCKWWNYYSSWLYNQHHHIFRTRIYWSGFNTMFQESRNVIYLLYLDCFYWWIYFLLLTNQSQLEFWLFIFYNLNMWISFNISMEKKKEKSKKIIYLLINLRVSSPEYHRCFSTLFRLVLIRHRLWRKTPFNGLGLIGLFFIIYIFYFAAGNFAALVQDKKRVFSTGKTI